MGIDLREILQERHKWAREYRKSGGRVIGCYSALVPEEILWACGFLPIQLCMSAGKYPKAQEYLPPYVCDCSKSILEQILDDTYEYLDGLLVAHVCETIRGLAGIWNLHIPDRFVHVFTPPANDDEGARSYLKAELSNLAERLRVIGGRPLTEENLEDAISTYNTNRRLIRRIYETRGSHPRAVRPEQVVSAVSSGMFMPKHVHNDMLKKFMETLELEAPGYETRVMLSGLTFENELINDDTLLRILEDSGALVVWDDFASGMRYRLRGVEESETVPPLDLLARSLLGPQPAPTRGPVERRAREMLKMADEYQAQGIIFLVPKYCDPILFDIPALTHMLTQNGCPSLVLEVSGTLSEGQIRTRVEAFLEMISGAPEAGPVHKD